MKTKESKVKIKGISFGVLLAGKVADGSKTATRRVVKFMKRLPELATIDYKSCKLNEIGCWFSGWLTDGTPFKENVPVPFSVGQILYVREPWRAISDYDWPKGSAHIPDGSPIQYLATSAHNHLVNGELDPSAKREIQFVRRRLARYMPARFARTFIRVTGVRCERLLEITGEDAISEGIDMRLHPDDGETKTWRDYRCTTRDKFVHGLAWGPKESFASLWDSVNHEKDKPKFADNPWVWVINFERVAMPNPWNEDQPFEWGWKRALFSYVSEACSGLVLQVVPEIATGLVVGFLNETKLGNFETYPAAQLACQAAARNYYLGLNPLI